MSFVTPVTQDIGSGKIARFMCDSQVPLEEGCDADDHIIGCTGNIDNINYVLPQICLSMETRSFIDYC
jgi:hypothetical protein